MILSGKTILNTSPLTDEPMEMETSQAPSPPHELQVEMEFDLGAFENLEEVEIS